MGHALDRPALPVKMPERAVLMAAAQAGSAWIVVGERGIVLQPNTSENSGLHGGLWRDGRWDGGADDRREGVARTQ